MKSCLILFLVSTQHIITITALLGYQSNNRSSLMAGGGDEFVSSLFKSSSSFASSCSIFLFVSNCWFTQHSKLGIGIFTQLPSSSSYRHNNNSRHCRYANLSPTTTTASSANFPSLLLAPTVAARNKQEARRPSTSSASFPSSSSFSFPSSFSSSFPSSFSSTLFASSSSSAMSNDALSSSHSHAMPGHSTAKLIAAGRAVGCRKEKEGRMDMDGVVLEALTNGDFRVAMNTPKQQKVLCAVGGKLRMNKIRICVGDGVRVDFSPPDFSRGRISYRYRPGYIKMALPLKKK
eukprot:GHVS01098724.1.p1 GENE.GHVS01098724.1~~GHVS01098724.1.p1  ORF type:complete len:291 (+),score=91.21 GHVS01098724.1:141-1013(+)